MPSRTHHRQRRACAALLLASLSCARVAAADTFVLDWNPNAEAEVAGYLVFIGTQSGNYSMTVDVGMATSYVFSSDVQGQAYFFALKAYAGAMQSPYSPEMIGVTNSAPMLAHPGTPGSVTGVASALQLQGADADGDTLTYAAEGLPAGMLLTQDTGLVSGVPTTAGTYSVAARVFDGHLWTTRSFIWTIGADAISLPAGTDAPPAPVPANPGSQSSMAGPLAVPVRTATAVARSRQPRGSSATASARVAGPGASTREMAGAAGTTNYTGATARARDVAIGGSAGTAVNAGSATARAVASSVAASTSVGSQRRPTSEVVARATAGSAPRVRIQTPIDGASFVSPATIIFSAAADDAEDGDLASQIVWSSSLDGRIGTGPSGQRQLSVGTHVLTASVSDKSGNSHNARIVVIIAR